MRRTRSRPPAQRPRRSSSSGVADGRRAVIVDRAEALADEMPIAPAPPGARAAPFVVGLADIGGEQVVVLDPDGFCAGSPAR